MSKKVEQKEESGKTMDGVSVSLTALVIKRNRFFDFIEKLEEEVAEAMNVPYRLM